MAEGLDITERTGFGLAAILARRGADPAAIGAALGVMPPHGPRAVSAGPLVLIGTGPSAWLAFVEAPEPGWLATLGDRLVPLASLSDQSGAYILLRIAGASARRLLQRGAAIDLHPRGFGPGSVAVTAIAEIGVIIRQLDDRPSYDIAVPRSFAGTFRHWIDTSVAALAAVV